jgi:hypothetical protein
MKVILKLSPDLPDLLARHGVGITEFAERSEVSRATVFALLNPAQHPERRRGGMHRTTAWRLAQAYGQVVGVDSEVAYRAIIREEPVEA